MCDHVLIPAVSYDLLFDVEHSHAMLFHSDSAFPLNLPHFKTVTLLSIRRLAEPGLELKI